MNQKQQPLSREKKDQLWNALTDEERNFILTLHCKDYGECNLDDGISTALHCVFGEHNLSKPIFFIGEYVEYNGEHRKVTDIREDKEMTGEDKWMYRITTPLGNKSEWVHGYQLTEINDLEECDDDCDDDDCDEFEEYDDGRKFQAGDEVRLSNGKPLFGDEMTGEVICYYEEGLQNCEIVKVKAGDYICAFNETDLVFANGNEDMSNHQFTKMVDNDDEDFRDCESFRMNLVKELAVAFASCPATYYEEIAEKSVSITNEIVDRLKSSKS